MIIQKGLHHYGIQTLQKKSPHPSPERSITATSMLQEAFQSKGEWGMECCSWAHCGGQRQIWSHSFGILHALLSVQLPHNPLAHIVSVSKGGGFWMWSGNMVSIFSLPSAVPFACLTFQRLTLSCAGSCVKTWSLKNEPLDGKVSLVEEDPPLPQKWGKTLLGCCFYMEDWILWKIVRIMEQSVSFHWPLAMTCKRKKKPHTKRNENTFYHFVPFRGPRSCVCYKCHVSLLHSSNQHRCSRARSWMLTFCVSWMQGFGKSVSELYKWSPHSLLGVAFPLFILYF